MSKLLSILKDQEFERYLQDILNRQTQELVERLQKEVLEADHEELSKLKYALNYHKEKIEKQENEIGLLKKHLEQKEKEINSMRLSYEEKVNEYRKAVSERSEIQSALSMQEMAANELKDIVRQYEKNYGEAEKIYVLYKELSDDTLKRLTNIFEKQDLISFMVSGVQWDNIEGLWNVARRKVIEEDTVDTDKLIEIFLFFFFVYNSRYITPEYCIIQPGIGERFNREKHNILGIDTDGYVKQIKLPGYCDGRGRVIGKALIKV